jgi:hypothetical protein
MRSHTQVFVPIVLRSVIVPILHSLYVRVLRFEWYECWFRFITSKQHLFLRTSFQPFRLSFVCSFKSSLFLHPYSSIGEAIILCCFVAMSLSYNSAHVLKFTELTSWTFLKVTSHIKLKEILLVILYTLNVVHRAYYKLIRNKPKIMHKNPQSCIYIDFIPTRFNGYAVILLLPCTLYLFYLW